MGVDAADFSHDGRLDLFVTNFTFQYDTLYWNQGAQGFADISAPAGIEERTHINVGWGTAFFDPSNTGWQDILVANGHVFPQVDAIKGAAPYRENVQLLRNNHDRTFTDISEPAGLNKLYPASWRGAAFGDVTNNGKIDVVILDEDGPPILLMNRTVSNNHAALFHLIGTKSNKAAIGARVTVTAGDLVQFNEVRGGSSYLSQNDLRLHFGLGAHATIDAVEIAWPSGAKETYKNLPADFIYKIVEGSGIQEKIAFTK